ncbi:MAG: DnaD domain protein [Oscillospiraceae bacterium]|nr:DnaD domain protein [Oscillospiraceae bacterium]
MKDTFIFKASYTEYFRQLDLSLHDIGWIVTAMSNYTTTGEVPTIDEAGPILYSAFMLIKVDLDKNAKKYAETCQKRSEAGRQGGRSRRDSELPEEGNQNKAKEANAFSESNCQQTKQTEQNNPDNDSGSDIVIDNDIDIDIVIDNAAAVANAPAAMPATAQEDPVRKLYEELIGPWNSHVQKTLSSFGAPPELICYAITEASNNNVLKLSYIAKILEAKKASGITDAKSARARPQKNSPSPQKKGLDPQAVIEMQMRLNKGGSKHEDSCQRYTAKQ